MNNSDICTGCPIHEKPSGDSVAEIRAKDRIFKVYSFRITEAGAGDQIRYVNTYVDVTEERNVQSRLLQTEKMATLGLLSNSVSHELNNPLTGIRSMAQVLSAEEAGDSQIKRDLTEVEKAAQRCEEIIKSFQEFAVGEVESAFEKIDLRDLVQKTVPFLKVSLRNHRWSIDSKEEHVSVNGHRPLLQQVIFNLINNACQAMKDSGEVRVQIEKDKKWARVRIHDTGPGIPETLQAHIFEPFFTTKASGQGTGLGLKVVQSIAKKHGGVVRVQSELGKGSEFIFEMPLA